MVVAVDGLDRQLTVPAPVGLVILGPGIALLAILPCLIMRRADIRE